MVSEAQTERCTAAAIMINVRGGSDFGPTDSD